MWRWREVLFIHVDGHNSLRLLLVVGECVMFPWPITAKCVHSESLDAVGDLDCDVMLSCFRFRWKDIQALDQRLLR